MSDRLKVKIADTIRKRINEKTHYLWVSENGTMGVIIPRVFDTEGFEIQHPPSAWELRPLTEILHEIAWHGTHE